MAGIRGDAGKEPAVGTLRVAYTDAPKELLDDVVSISLKAVRGLAKGDLKTAHEVAAAIRKDVAAKSPGTWHVIVGPEFGSFVTHEAGSVRGS
jgi:dynein light chain LC8-type